MTWLTALSEAVNAWWAANLMLPIAAMAMHDAAVKLRARLFQRTLN